MPIKQKVFSIKHNEDFQNLERKIPMQVQEAYRTPTRQEQKSPPYHFILNYKYRTTSILKTATEKVQVTYQGRLIKKKTNMTNFQNQNGLGRSILSSQQP